MNSADIKREILRSSDKTGIRKRLVSGEAGLDSNDIIEIGVAFKSLVQHKGWSYVEAYILKNANPVGLLFGADDPLLRGKAQALILLMQYVQQTILAAEDLLAKENATREK